MTLHAVFSASAIVVGHEFVKTFVFAQIIRQINIAHRQKVRTQSADLKFVDIYYQNHALAQKFIRNHCT